MEKLTVDDSAVSPEGGVVEPASCTNCSHMQVCGMAARVNAHLQGFASGGLVKAGSKKEMQGTMNDMEVAMTAAQGAACEQYHFQPELKA